jgi:hypothetical protein
MSLDVKIKLQGFRPAAFRAGDGRAKGFRPLNGRAKGFRPLIGWDQQAGDCAELSPRIYPVAAGAGGDAVARRNSHRSGSHSIRCSVVGFSPRANKPGNASRR